MRGPAPAPPRFIALGFPERVMMRCVRVLVQKKSDAVGITLSANPCTGAQVAPPRCLVFRYSQKQFHDTITARICQGTNWPPIMTLTGRELRPCWPGIMAICIWREQSSILLLLYHKPRRNARGVSVESGLSEASGLRRRGRYNRGPS